MSFQKFKGEVWSEKFQEDLDKVLVFKENCNHSYEGDARQAGDSVRIFRLGDVPIGAWHNGKLGQLGNPDEISGSSIVMPINEVNYFNFFIDDLDKEQAKGGKGMLAKYTSKAKDNMADIIDQFIAGLHLKDDKVNAAFVDANGDPAPAYVDLDGKGTGATAILDAIDTAYLKLLKNNVSRSTKVTLTLDPTIIMLLKRAYVELDTDNSDMIKNGRVGRYGGIELKESNNVNVEKTTIGGSQKTVFHCQLKTDNALAFVNPYTHMEGFRPDDYFRDCVKGYTLYDGKVVAPKEVVDFNVYL